MEFKIQNMVGSCDVKFPIRLEGLVVKHSQFSRYKECVKRTNSQTNTNDYNAAFFVLCTFFFICVVQLRAGIIPRFDLSYGATKDCPADIRIG